MTPELVEEYRCRVGHSMQDHSREPCPAEPSERCWLCICGDLIHEVERLRAKAEFWEHRADCLELNKGLAG